MTGTAAVRPTSGFRSGEPFRVTVEFLSDWCWGAGTARNGAVDRQVQRDEQGFPMLGGKALGAMLRDAAETVAFGLDEGRHGRWHRWVETVFGGQTSTTEQTLRRRPPIPAALSPRPLRVPAPMRRAICAEAESGMVIDSLVVTRPGVQVDRRTGVALDDTYRIEERARAGLTVSGDCTLTFPGGAEPGGPVPWEAELLLLAAARWVDSVGGKRRRGAGRCTVTVDVPGGSSADERLAELLGRLDEAADPPDPTGTVTVARLGERLAGGPLRHRFDLTITARTPFVVPQGLRGNVVRTESFVPGTMLLPLVARALGSEATRMITGGRVAVTNATLVLDGRRSTPTPLALRRHKDAGDRGPLINGLGDVDAETRAVLREVGGFCVHRPDGALALGEPRVVSRAHAVIDDRRQRPTIESGGLFVNQAIAAGTVLRAELWLSDDVTVNTRALAGRRALGRSKKDDYGQVDLAVTDVTEAVDRRDQIPGRGGELAVWLQSDVLLRGVAGQPDATVTRLGTVLGDALGVVLEPFDDGMYAATRRIESWQTRWSLPRPSLTGLAGGSVVRFRMSGHPSDEAYRRVEADGVGERAVEGFGRVALNPPLLAVESVHVTDHAGGGGDDGRGGSGEAAEEDRVRVRPLVQQAWRDELARAALRAARDRAVRRLLVPENASAAQLGNLRTLATRLQADGVAPALGWLGDLRARRSAIWGNDRIDRLERLIQGHADDELWDRLLRRRPTGHEAELRLPALAVLLSEVARTQAAASRTNGEDS